MINHFHSNAVNSNRPNYDTPTIQSTSDGRYSQSYSFPRNNTNTTLATISENGESVVFPTALVNVHNSEG